MPILCKQDMTAARDHGLIDIEGITEINATSLDVRIGQLLTPSQDRKDMKEVPLIDGEYWLLKPGDFFLYETVERFRFSHWFHGKINSRSSWARYGVASADVHDEFSEPHGDFYGKVICSIRTLGTTVKIRPGDTIAQAHIAFGGFIPALDDVLREEIKTGQLKITRRGKEIQRLVQTFAIDEGYKVGAKVPGGRKMNSGFTLTHDPIIKIYTGEVIDPKEPSPTWFKERRLANRGTYIKAGTFFLSASAEEVSIDKHFVGWVHEWNHLMPTSGYVGPGIHEYSRHSSLQTHAGAPKIDPFPRFSGKITFENYAMTDVTIRPGERLADFHLYYLHSPWELEDKDKSQYNEQTGATDSRL
ncbi:MAG: hypothetical protein V1729_07195 [Candidatus Woesearchaeota archaeon]